MVDEQTREAIGRIEAFVRDLASSDEAKAEMLQGYGLGHSLAMAVLMSFMVEKGMVSVEEIESRMLATASMCDGRPGGETAKQAISHIMHLVMRDKKGAN